MQKAMTERRLLELTGSNEQNPTFDLPCRKIFAAGQKPIEVVGPFPELEAEARGKPLPARAAILQRA